MDRKPKVDMGNEKISRLIYKLGMPATVGMLVNALYNVVDTVFLGQGVGSLAISALTVAFPIQNLILGVGLMTGIGAASMISRSLGENRTEKADQIAGNAFLSIFLMATAMAVVGLIFMDPMLRLFGASDTVLPYAREYMRVILIGWLWFPLMMTANHIARSEGAARVAMVAMIIGTGLNIVLDPIFIFVLDMGIAGAAWATILAQLVSIAYQYRYFSRGHSMIRLGWKYLKPDMGIIKEMYAVGMSAFAQQASASGVGIIMNNAIVTWGQDLALAAYGVVFRVHAFIFMPLFGTVQALQPIVGYNYGARNVERIEEAVRQVLKWLTLIAVVGTALCLLFPGFILMAFTREPELLDLGARAMRIMSVMIPVVGVQIAGSVLYQAVGKAGPALFLALLRQVILTLPLVLILPRFFGLDGVWLVYPVSDLIAAAITGWMMWREMKVLRRELA